MPRKLPVALLFLPLAACTGKSADSASHDSRARGDDSGGHGADTSDTSHTARGPARMAIPGYFYPDVGQPDSLWDRAIALGGVFVFNPDSGPGGAQNGDYVTATHAAMGHVTLLAYVSTGYGTRDADAVLADMANYAAWYPLSGFFFDEAPGTDTCDAEYGAYAGYAAAARDAVPGAFVALNPGTDTCVSYLDFADLLLTFESDAPDYAGHTSAMPPDPDHTWHLVYGTGDWAGVLDHAAELDAGYVYVTDDVLPNPWDTLPTWLEDEAAYVP